MRPLLIALSITYLFNPGFSLAQFGGLAEFNATQNNLNLTLDPATPAPNTEFRASLGMVDFGSEVVWTLNGEKLLDSNNQNNINLLAGEAGETINLSAEITTPDGRGTTVSTEITPLYLDIILEPQTYAPDFYLGRSLPTFGSQVNATAILSGTDITATDLVYRWQVGNEVVGEGALLGQHKVSFSVPKGSFPTLSLQVSRPSGELLASRYITMPSVYPELKFYQKSTLFGLSQKPIDNNLNLISDSTLIEAVPYNLDSRVYNSPDMAEWEVGRDTYDNLAGNPYEVTLQRNSGAGSIKLNFHVRSMENLLQGAEDSINVRP
jgi:hypothetical protein